MKRISLCLMALSLSLTAAAAEPSFGFNQEFFAVCDEKALTLESAASQFEALAWDAVEDEDVASFLVPDDVLSKVDASKAYNVELDDGSAWYGVFATGTLGQGAAVNYCQLLFATDDLTEWKDDFQGALEFGTPIQVGTDAIDKRWVWADAAKLDDSTGGYVFREVSTEDISYITASRYWFR